jgi:hypothetical protein
MPVKKFIKLYNILSQRKCCDVDTCEIITLFYQLYLQEFNITKYTAKWLPCFH